jgi:rhamnogalacturonan endolyase
MNIKRTALLLLVAVTTAHAGSISVVSLPATGTDAASGINATNSYKCALDFGNATTAVSVNGVSFQQLSLSGKGTGADNSHPLFTGTDAIFGGTWTLAGNYAGTIGFAGTSNTGATSQADGSMQSLLSDLTYLSSTVAVGNTATLTLGNLTPGAGYSLRCYYRQWNTTGTFPRRPVSFAFNGEGANESYVGNPLELDAGGAKYIQYDFTAASTSVSAQMTAQLANNGPHIYAVTLQQTFAPLVAPAIAAQPQGFTNLVGNSAALSVGLSNSPPAVYKWLKNAAPVSGATNATLNFPSLTLADSGAYQVIVTNAIGSVTSSVANVLVLDSLPNFPGGWTPLVTTPVTTGTESDGGGTVRFLDNGILHVQITSAGNVSSIKYLKPGSAGTPAANGIEQVSQFGVSNPAFGNHTEIYYYVFPDGGGGTYASAGVSSTNIDLCFVRPYNPAIHQVVADVETHYALGQGNRALYIYLVVKHPASYASYNTNCQIDFIQMIWPVAHDNTDFLCEKMFIDTDVKTGLSQNGVQQNRAALEPNFYDSANSTTVAGLPGEISRLTSGVFSNQLTGKYSYAIDYYKFGCWGRASDVNKLGQWVVMGSHEYMNNGVTMCDYVNGFGLMYNTMVSPHYGNTSITVNNNANWTKIFGPWALYFNNHTNAEACWEDAKHQAVAEQSAWPYAWLTNSSYYQSASQRATVTGKLVINDALRPGASAAGAWVGLAAPDSGGENAADNWQFQSEEYQYWVQCAADGSFTIPDVQTFSTYGGLAAYKFYAFSAGTNRTTGCFGEFQTSAFTLNAGVTNFGTLTWNVPHQGGQMVWEVGIPDRTAREYVHGDEYAVPALWLDFTNEFPNPLQYYVASNNWDKVLNYDQARYGGTTGWKWQINFNLATVRPGNYWLNLAYAGNDSDHVYVYVNSQSSSTLLSGPPASGGNSLFRQGIHGKYGVQHFAIASSKLKVGSNYLILAEGSGTASAQCHIMYDYFNLEGPAVSTPRINYASMNAGKMIVRGTNGTLGVTYVAMASTNLSLPLPQWTPIYTNTFAADGTFAFTNSPNSAVRQTFYTVQVP